MEMCSREQAGMLCLEDFCHVARGLLESNSRSCAALRSRRLPQISKRMA